MRPHFFITGTDTEVGKTYVMRLLLEGLARQGETVAGYKPICCGDREDAELLLAASNVPGLRLDEVNPCWFRNPASPLAASRIETDRYVDWEGLLDGFNRLAARADRVLVEGVGGWKVPINVNLTVADLARALHLPVLVVARNQLGTLNHSLLTVQAIRASGVDCLGLVLNHPSDRRDAASIQNAAILRDLLAITVVELMHGEEDWPAEAWLELLPENSKE